MGGFFLLIMSKKVLVLPDNFLNLFTEYASSSHKNLQDIITDAQDDDLRKLRCAEEFLDFSIICDKQEILDKNYWKLNERKVLNWLITKHKTIKETLSNIEYTEPSSVSSYVKVLSDEEKKEQFIHSSIGFLSEYIS